MANYHFGIDNVSRGKGHSLACRLNYVSGERIRDLYLDTPHCRHRSDVLYCEVFLPVGAPQELRSMQILCNRLDAAEARYDARTAREFKCSLPNELSAEDLVRITKDFVTENFTDKGLCAVVAIHDKRNPTDPSKNNPHAHIVVATRFLDGDGLSRKKDREHNKRSYVNAWRAGWARVVNLGYERAGLKERVSPDSYEVQGIYDKEPTNHLSLVDYQKECRGERTERGDEKRAIQERNEERQRQRSLGYERGLDIEPAR